jgi:microcystin-dependent protein
MSYIGNAKSPLIIGSNTRDDLVPTFDGQTTFQLSQEVPGGYENSIIVLKQAYTTQSIISNNTDISIVDTDRTVLVDGELVARTEARLTTTSPYIAVSLSNIKPGDHITVSLSDASSSLNDTFEVIDVIYTGDATHVYIATTITQRTSVGDEVSITAGRYDDWTILEPEKDYTLGTTTDTAKTLTLSKAISLNDKAYVLHKGEATYNLTPSEKSVGPAQLQDNLRNFRCDRYTADGTTTTFILSGTDNNSYDVVDAKSLLVSVNGEILDSIHEDAGADVGSWSLDTDRTEDGFQTITFTEAPDNEASVRILHLGFSTVSRRASFSPGQQTVAVLDDSVGTDQLKNDAVSEAKLSNNSVTTTKIRNNAVTGAKVLLNNEDAIRGKTTAGAEQDLLKIASDNSTSVSGATEVSVNVNGTKTVAVSSTQIVPETSNVSLGSSSKKFKDAHFSGDVSVAGNISLESTSTVGGVNISTLNDTVTALKTLINSGALSPVGSIMIWSSPSVPSTYLRCDGTAVNTYTYRELHAIISNVYGGAAYQAGVTDVVGATTTFNLPDLVTRFPVGANTTGSNIGQNDNVAKESRTISHSHVGAAHTHTYTHTHSVPGHYHTVDTSAGSNIAIASSGSHITSLNHTHLNAYNRSNGLLNTDPGSTPASSLIYASGHTGVDPTGNASISRNAFTTTSLFSAPGVNQTPWQDGEHLHSSTTGLMSVPHSHKVFVNDHAHNIGYREAIVRKRSDTSSENATINQVASVGAASTAQAAGTGGFVASVGSAPQGTAFNTDVTGSDSTSHSHSININRISTTHLTGSTQHFTVTGAHSHFVTIPEHRGDSASTGLHTHATSTFSGSIGKVTAGSNGNADITTSSMTTSDATVPAPTTEQLGTTGATTQSHLVVNFIIKATNTQVI